MLWRRLITRQDPHRKNDVGAKRVLLTQFCSSHLVKHVEHALHGFTLIASNLLLTHNLPISAKTPELLSLVEYNVIVSQHIHLGLIVKLLNNELCVCQLSVIFIFILKELHLTDHILNRVLKLLAKRCISDMIIVEDLGDEVVGFWSRLLTSSTPGAIDPILLSIMDVDLMFECAVLVNMDRERFLSLV